MPRPILFKIGERAKPWLIEGGLPLPAQQVPNSGALASTLADVTVASTATVAINATEATTLADVTVAATAKVAISATEASTLADVTLASTGKVAISASLAVTLGDTTAASTAALAISASLAATLADATLASTATVGGGISATLSATLGDVTLVSAATLGAAPATAGRRRIGSRAKNVRANVRTVPRKRVIPLDDLVAGEEHQGQATAIPPWVAPVAAPGAATALALAGATGSPIDPYEDDELALLLLLAA